MDNKRRFSRVRVPFDVMLTTLDGVTVSGALRDIAIQGAFITCESLLDLGTEVEVDITLHGGVEDIHIVTSGEVVHQEAEGLGIRFTGLEPDSVGHLRNLIVYNADDADRVLTEIYEGGSRRSTDAR
jgi:hypothetical protein